MSAWVSWELFGLLVLLLLAAMLNGAESAYFSLGRLRLRRLSESGAGPGPPPFHIAPPAMLNGREAAFFPLGRLRPRGLSKTGSGPGPLALHIARPHDLLVTLLV